jgi:hypothetical protein
LLSQVSFSSIKGKGYSRVVSILEKETGSLFGQLWTQLSDEQYRSSVELFLNARMQTGLIFAG